MCNLSIGILSSAGFSKATKTWLPVHKNYMHLNLAKQKREPQSHYKLFQTLIKLKKSSKTLISGSLIIDTLNDDKVLVVSRQFYKESIVFVANFSNDDPQKIDLSNYLSGAMKATVIVSSVGSDITWGYVSFIIIILFSLFCSSIYYIKRRITRVVIYTH
jgi:alpha-glucosidase